MSKDINDLDPDVAEMARQFLAQAAKEGVLLRITQTRRTYLEQEDIYAQGRSKPGKIVTAARPGYSWHNFGRAFDVCQAAGEPYPDHEPFWEKVGDIGKRCGLDWGGDWKHPDRPHFEHHGGLTLAQARAKTEETLA